MIYETIIVEYEISTAIIKINRPNELNALNRKVFEELGVTITNFDLKAVIENFFVLGVRKFHEICFVYQTDEVLEKELSSGFAVFDKTEIEKIDLKPEIMKKIIVII